MQAVPWGKTVDDPGKFRPKIIHLKNLPTRDRTPYTPSWTFRQYMWTSVNLQKKRTIAYYARKLNKFKKEEEHENGDHRFLRTHQQTPHAGVGAKKAFGYGYQQQERQTKRH